VAVSVGSRSARLDGSPVRRTLGDEGIVQRRHLALHVARERAHILALLEHSHGAQHTLARKVASATARRRQQRRRRRAQPIGGRRREHLGERIAQPAHSHARVTVAEEDGGADTIGLLHRCDKLAAAARAVSRTHHTDRREGV
jgi:hypothetical protein